MEEERRETYTRLVEYIAVSPEEAERMMRDDDLWLVEPQLRVDVPDEEAVEQWRIASHVLGSLFEVADQINLATLVAIMDAQCRAGVALERAQERVRQAREEG